MENVYGFVNLDFSIFPNGGREMDDKMRVMSEKPLNAETSLAHLQSWTTSNTVFFKRNQGQIMDSPVDLDTWRLSVAGLVEKPLDLRFADILALPKVEMAVTLECSGNGRSLLKEKASGNTWTLGGVGNAVWGGVALGDILEQAGVGTTAGHVGFEGLDKPLGSAGIKFIRSIPLAKALDSTILAYEMNGEPLPVEHGFPLRAIALGWTGANCVKWLCKISLLERPYQGFFMDKVYRVFQKGQDPATGEVVTAISLKSIITAPENQAKIVRGRVAVHGAAYAGDAEIAKVEVSVDDGVTWQEARFIGPHERWAWRRWEYLWQAENPGQYRILARATDSRGQVQPMTAQWNVLGYGNNGIKEHAIVVTVEE
jgi:DMSO/TMAO reductase YedYZ molybdopterin-dependent catalytic subunit